MKQRKPNRRALIPTLLLLLAVCLGLFSCQNTEQPSTPGSDGSAGGSTAVSETETADGGNTVRDLTLATGTKAAFTVVRPEGCSSALASTVATLVDTLHRATGAWFVSTTDSDFSETPVESSMEIIIGNCYRADTVRVLKSLKYKDYEVCLTEKNIVVAAYTDEAAINGAQRLAQMIENNTVKDDRGAVLTWKKDYIYRALIYKLKDITLNNVSVQDFRIVYPAKDTVAQSVAENIQTVIGESCGAVPEVVPDSEPKAEHEILVGNTARSTEETASANLQQGQYLMLAKGGNIYFIGSSATLTTTLATEFKAYLDAKKGVLDDMNERKSLTVPGEFAANTGDVRIMEYNVLVEFAGWGSGGKIPADVNLRKGIIASLINGYSPDVLCLCEFFDTWSRELPPLLDSKYKFVSLMRPDGLSNRTSLVYNSETLTLIEGGYEDISIHPTTDAPWNDDVNRRVIMWGVFEVKATGKRFMTLGTHYTSTAGATSELTAQEHLEAQKVMQAEMTLKRLDTLKKTYDVPAMILGDLNTAKGSDCYATIKRWTGYGDVADSFPNDYLADHIFYDPKGFSLKNAILEKGKKADTASDHWPMIADFSFLK